MPAIIVGTAAIATQALILRMSLFCCTVICVRLAVSAASSSPDSEVARVTARSS